ncbi:MAG: hypothetical protein J7485_08205 [Sphingobium sp.]|nr:hypothetical protein [Sphingobium sp.]
MAVDTIDIEESVRSVQADLKYLLPGTPINRRFVSAGVEVNTGKYGPYEMTIRDARPIRDHFSLASHGFKLLDAPTAVNDFTDTQEVEAKYSAEVERYVQEATGADFVWAMGWMIRTSGDVASRQKQRSEGESYQHRAGVQPPAGEVHVDTDPGRQIQAADRAYAKVRPNGPGYKRFIISSFWRTYSPPPQDCPLAICDGRSVRDDEGTPNTLWVVDKIPDDLFAPMPVADEDNPIAAAIFHHNPDHRWWYFSNMVKDEALLFKFHDSAQQGAWRVPHTAFWDSSLPGAQPRESIECRSIAFFE